MEWYEAAFNAVEFVMLGVVQIAVIALVMRPIERRWGVERGEEGLVGVDRVYTALNKLGVVPLLVFVAAYPITNELDRLVRILGLAPPRLESLVPGLHDNALLSFLAYFVLYDFAAYWVHRAQHRFGWWWALHSLHHALADAREPHIHDHNFAPVFPVWDVLFGTARFDMQPRPTGVDDREIDADNGHGWLGQQVRVFKRFATALIPPKLQTRS